MDWKSLSEEIGDVVVECNRGMGWKSALAQGAFVCFSSSVYPIMSAKEKKFVIICQLKHFFYIAADFESKTKPLMTIRQL